MKKYTGSGLPVVTEETRKEVEQLFLEDYLSNDDFSKGSQKFDELQSKDLWLFRLGSLCTTTALEQGLQQRLSWIQILGVYEMLEIQSQKYGKGGLPQVSENYLNAHAHDCKQRANPLRAQEVYTRLTEELKRENPEVLNYINRMKRLGSHQLVRMILGFNGIQAYEALDATSQSKQLEKEVNG